MKDDRKAGTQPANGNGREQKPNGATGGGCAGPGIKAFAEACVGSGALEAESAQGKQKRCKACIEQARQRAARQERRRRGPRSGPKALRNDEVWQDAFRRNLQRLEADEDEQLSRPRYIRVRMEHEGKVVQVEKIDLRAAGGRTAGAARSTLAPNRK